MEKPWKGTIPEGKEMGKLVFLPLKRRWRILQFGSQLTTGWVHHFILGYSNISWEKWKKRRWKTDR